MRFFTWDPAKATSNSRKHGVAFEEAIAAFDDPNAVTVADRIEDGEQRWQTIGNAGVLVLMVVHTEEDDDGDEIVRIISARRVTRQERRRYEGAFGARHGR